MIFALHISVPECERSFDCKDDTKPYCNSKSICVGNLNLIIYDFSNCPFKMYLISNVYLQTEFVLS